jgi:hypothetical protein
VLETKTGAQPAVSREVVIHLGEVVSCRSRSRRKAGVIVKQPARRRSGEKFREGLRNRAEAGRRDYIVQERLVGNRIMIALVSSEKSPARCLVIRNHV